MDEDGELSVDGSVNTKTTLGGGGLYNEDYTLCVAQTRTCVFLKELSQKIAFTWLFFVCSEKGETASQKEAFGFVCFFFLP